MDGWVVFIGALAVISLLVIAIEIGNANRYNGEN